MNQKRLLKAAYNGYITQYKIQVSSKGVGAYSRDMFFNESGTMVPKAIKDKWMKVAEAVFKT